MTKEIATFVTALNITEIQGHDYIFTFSNVYNGNTYTFQITKQLFDSGFKERDKFEGEATVMNVEDIEKQTINAGGMHG